MSRRSLIVVGCVVAVCVGLDAQVVWAEPFRPTIGCSRGGVPCVSVTFRTRGARDPTS